MTAVNTTNFNKLEYSTPPLELAPLPLHRPLLTIGHGTRDESGRQSFLDFTAAYQALDTSRPVLPCFLELTEPTISTGSRPLCRKRLYRAISTAYFCYLQLGITNLMSQMN